MSRTQTTTTKTNYRISKYNIQSELLRKYIRSVSIRNQNTASQYYLRLLLFEKFLEIEHCTNIDKLIQKLKNREYDPYDILNDYCLFLQNNYNLSSVTFRDKIITVKTFLEYNDIEISPRKFKLKVKFPKTVLRYKEAIDKGDIIKILNGCSDLRLKTYVMLLASTGLRATEALSIRLKDLDITTTGSNNNNSSAKLIIRGQYTKTKVDRYVFLTREVLEQIKTWLDYKYRKRRICYKDKETGKSITEYRTPEKKQNELVFSIIQTDNPKPRTLYINLGAIFAKTLDRIGMGSREDGNETRREITLHSFRRFVKTTISDLGYSDYSEWYIGHAGSTYWRKKDSEKAEIFKKIESYLTFLNVPQLERQGADLQTKIEELQIINQSLRENDKIKEDALTHLSDQLLGLSERIQQLERKHSPLS
ncbi:MAG: tyrosine-type recombinase/integrase [Deltaproteobacteria bacterium]